MTGAGRDTALAALEDAFNEWADRDSEWWPFGFMRPAPHQPFGTLRCLALAGLYGMPAALVAALAGAIFGETMPKSQLPAFIGCACAATFVVLRSTAVFWNRRARRRGALVARRAAFVRQASDRSATHQAHDERDGRDDQEPEE